MAIGKTGYSTVMYNVWYLSVLVSQEKTERENPDLLTRGLFVVRDGLEIFSYFVFMAMHIESFFYKNRIHVHMHYCSVFSVYYLPLTPYPMPAAAIFTNSSWWLHMTCLDVQSTG